MQDEEFLLIYHVGVGNISFTDMPGNARIIQVLKCRSLEAKGNAANINYIYSLKLSWLLHCGFHFALQKDLMQGVKRISLSWCECHEMNIMEKVKGTE